MSDKADSKGTKVRSGISRRSFLQAGAAGIAGAAAGFTMKSTGPFIRNAEAATLNLRWLGWEHYNVEELTNQFQKQFKVRVSAGFFDGNSEAYNKLKAGGTDDFDLVMADGFWPRLYNKQGLTQPVDYQRLSNIKHVFADFLPPKYTLLKEQGSDNMVAAPNCWGGYGNTVNMDKVDPDDAHSLTLLFNEKYKGHLSTSDRYEENIAEAGILAATRLGTINSPRPPGNGSGFNPYVLTDEELEEAKKLLIKQKPLLVTRWKDEDTLERLLRSQVVWASPEWSGIFRRIYFDKLDGKSNLNMEHVLTPKEGGLGWVDTWNITSGVKDSEKLEVAIEWINFRLRPESMATVATEIGWSPTVDVRKLVPERYVESLFMDKTYLIHQLYPFDAPSSPEKWERVWSEVQAA
jgi:spermidine/putrescine transport system substrate-binding protein